MKTVPPGLMPSLSRNSFGMTICPLGPTFPVTDVPNGDQIMPVSLVVILVIVSITVTTTDDLRLARTPG